MRKLLSALAIVFVIGTPLSAQPEITGLWQTSSEGRWALWLKKDGTRTLGAARACGGPAMAISDIAIEGDTISFKCEAMAGNPPETRTITLTGKIKGDEIEFTWQLHGPLFQRGDPVFGPTSPNPFIAKRVPNGSDTALDGLADPKTRGMEFAAAYNLVPRDIKVEATLFVPPSVSRVRVLLVAIRYGLGFDMFWSPQWRQMAQTLDAAVLGVRFSGILRSEEGNAGIKPDDAAGRPEALLTVLQRLAQDSGHKELSDAPLVFWGHSAGADMAATFAGQLPERTVAFVRYHYGDRQGADLGVVSKIPALFLSGGKEDNANNAPSTARLWSGGRLVGAPWTFAVEPNATHGDPKDLEKANDVLIPWLTAVIRARLPTDGTTLRIVNDQTAWFGDNRTGEIATTRTFMGTRSESSWLPDEASARGWQKVLDKEK